MRLIMIIAVSLIAACSDAGEKPPTQKEVDKAARVLTRHLEATGQRNFLISPEERSLTRERFKDVSTAMESPPRPTALQTETFGPLTGFIGKSFKGYPSGENEPYDLQKWEWALGGTSILIRHAMEDGSYGGDTYVYKDAASGDLVYVYITNAGFRTEGVMTVNEDGSFTAVEDVLGHATITQVSSTSRLNADGTTTMTSQYLKDGEWTDGHSFNYAATKEPLPTLKGPPPL